MGGPFERIKFEASPYLRALQTCAQVARGFGHTAPIEVNYMIAEQQEARKQYNGNSIPSLLSRTDEEFSEKYLRDYPFVDNGKHMDYLLTRYPETLDQCQKRAQDLTNDLIAQNTTERTLIVMVGHGTPIKLFS